MRSRLLVIILAFTLLFIWSAAPPKASAADSPSMPTTDPYLTRHVIVAVMDGVRYSETFGDPEHRYIPRMWKELAPQGTLYTNFCNRGVTVTRQGHSTIASGTWQTVPNGGLRLTMPTFFEYYREEKGTPADKTWAIFGKGSYSFAPYSSFPTYGDKWVPRAEIGIGEGSLQDDRRVLDRILAVMKEYKPGIIFANFGCTDHSGHVGSFEDYTEAIANVDDIFAILWDSIQSDPEYRNSTTLILTNDHGRHDDAHGGFHGHGCGCEGCRHVFLLILGPDTKKGVVILQPASQIDIAPTVGELLGFQMPLAEGRPLAESFISSRGLNRNQPRTKIEQEAVHIKQLADRNLVRAVLQHLMEENEIADLPAAPETAVLFQGITSQLSNTAALGPAYTTLATRAVRDWLEKTENAKGLWQLYRSLVLLDMARFQGKAYSDKELAQLDNLSRKLLSSIQSDNSA